MDVDDERITDLVRVDQGRWMKDEEGVWRFTGVEERLGMWMRFREGDGVAKAKTKLMTALNIDPKEEKLELTYEMPEWMDVDGKVKPVPIHIQTDDDMDMFIAMRVDIHEMKLYIVRMPLNMELEIDGFKVVATMDDMAFAEVMSKDEMVREQERRKGKEAIDDVICSQLPKEPSVESSGSQPGWIGNDYQDSGFRTLSAAMRHYRSVLRTVKGRGSPAGVVDLDDSSSEGETDIRATPLTRKLFQESDTEGTPLTAKVGNRNEAGETGKGELAGSDSRQNPGERGRPAWRIGHSNVEGMVRELSLPSPTFTRDAAPVLDDTDPDDGDRRRAVYDVDYEGDDLFLGRVFKNKDDCRFKITIHAINRRFSVRNERTTNDVMTVRCASRACSWRVYSVRLEDTENFQIRTAELVHTCPIESRSQFQRQASTSVISEIIRARYTRSGAGPTPTAIRRSMFDELRVNVSYWKAWRSRELALDLAKGSAAGSYGLLPTYLHMVEKTNVGSVTELQTVMDANGDQRFKYCFVAFGASVRGWSFMRNVIVVDGTHLGGKYMGCLLTASAQDGNFQIFPLGFAIVDSENDKAWQWFFSCLRKFVPDHENITFVSDRHSSIASGLEKVYPQATHGACIVHLQRNVAVKFKQPRLAATISKAVRAYRKSTFHEYFAEIERVSPECAEYLMGIGLRHWTRSHCDGERYNIMTSNVAESLNAVLKEAWELPIVSNLEYIRGTLMAWFTKRREIASKQESALTPKVNEIVQKNYQQSTGYEVLKINNGEYEIKTTFGQSYVVNIPEKTCTCEEWTHLKIPCSHAIAAAIRCVVEYV